MRLMNVWDSSGQTRPIQLDPFALNGAPVWSARDKQDCRSSQAVPCWLLLRATPLRFIPIRLPLLYRRRPPSSGRGSVSTAAQCAEHRRFASWFPHPFPSFPGSPSCATFLFHILSLFQLRLHSGLRNIIRLKVSGVVHHASN